MFCGPQADESFPSEAYKAYFYQPQFAFPQPEVAFFFFFLISASDPGLHVTFYSLNVFKSTVTTAKYHLFPRDADAGPLQRGRRPVFSHKSFFQFTFFL